MQIDVVKAIKDQAEASSDPATKCRSRSRSLASIGSQGNLPPQALLYRRSSAQQTPTSVDYSSDIPFADNDAQDLILDEIIEEQEDAHLNNGAAAAEIKH